MLQEIKLVLVPNRLIYIIGIVAALLFGCSRKTFYQLSSKNIDSTKVYHSNFTIERFSPLCCGHWSNNDIDDLFGSKRNVLDTVIKRKDLNRLILNELGKSVFIPKDTFCVDVITVVVIFFGNKSQTICIGNGGGAIEINGRKYLNNKFIDLITLLFGPNLYEIDGYPEHWKYSYLIKKYPWFK